MGLSNEKIFITTEHAHIGCSKEKNPFYGDDIHRNFAFNDSGDIRKRSSEYFSADDNVPK